MFGRFPAGTVRDLRRFPYDIFTVLLFKVRECFLRSHLRQTTAAAHAQLDAIVGSFVSLQDYGRYLQHLLAFREPIETAVLSARPLEKLNFHFHPIASAIRADMIDLGLPASPPRQVDIAQLAVTDTSELLGTLYVLEGSALGARVLYKRAQALRLSADHGARHLALQAEDRTSWPAFLAILDAHDPLETERTAVASAAAFDLALAAFSESSP